MTAPPTVIQYLLNYQTYVIEGDYASLVDSVLYAKVKALRAYLLEFNMDSSVSIIDGLDLQPGNALMVLETINSFVNPEIRRKLSEQGLSHAAQDVANDLRNHLKIIANQDTADFLEESINCFENGHYRAAVIMSWVGAVSLLHEYVIQKKLAQFNIEAVRRNPKWKTAKTGDDLGRMKEFEFLEILVALSIIGKNVKQELNTCLRLRNACGHPNSLKIGQNKVAAHIETLIQNVFAKFS